MLWDYIFVGGGLSASVVSNRLYQLDPSLKILVIEAGGNANNDPSVVFPNSTNLIGGEYDWKYQTVPQVNLDNRQIDLPCGKALGGGTVINSGKDSTLYQQRHTNFMHFFPRRKSLIKPDDDVMEILD